MFHKCSVHKYKYLMNEGTFGWKQTSADSKIFEMINHFKRTWWHFTITENCGAQYGHIRCSWWRKKLSSQSVGIWRIRPLDSLELTVRPWKSKRWKMKPSYVRPISADFRVKLIAQISFRKCKNKKNLDSIRIIPLFFFQCGRPLLNPMIFAWDFWVCETPSNLEDHPS